MSLVWKRKKREPIDCDSQIAIKVSGVNYNRILEYSKASGLFSCSHIRNIHIRYVGTSYKQIY